MLLNPPVIFHRLVFHTTHCTKAGGISVFAKSGYKDYVKQFKELSQEEKGADGEDAWEFFMMTATEKEGEKEEAEQKKTNDKQRPPQ